MNNREVHFCVGGSNSIFGFIMFASQSNIYLQIMNM